MPVARRSMARRASLVARCPSRLSLDEDHRARALSVRAAVGRAPRAQCRRISTRSSRATCSPPWSAGSRSIRSAPAPRRCRRRRDTCPASPA
eukprot:471530-Prymnesium_polylepis.1